MTEKKRKERSIIIRRERLKETNARKLITLPFLLQKSKVINKLSSVGEKDFPVTADQKQRWIRNRFKIAALRKLAQCGKEIRFITGKKGEKSAGCDGSVT